MYVLGVEMLFQVLTQHSYITNEREDYGTIMNDAFKVLISMAASDQIENEDMSRLLEILQTSNTSPKTRCGVLSLMTNMMIVNARVSIDVDMYI